MNRSGIQLARLRLWVRRASSQVLSRSSRHSCTSACHGSRYTQAAPLRLPPWLTAATEESSVFSHGTMPLEWPLVDRISDTPERTPVSLTPRPPLTLELFALTDRQRVGTGQKG